MNKTFPKKESDAIIEWCGLATTKEIAACKAEYWRRQRESGKIEG